MKKIITVSLFIFVSFFILHGEAYSEMTSSKYKISNDSISGTMVGDDINELSLSGGEGEVAGAETDSASENFFNKYIKEYLEQIVIVLIVAILLGAYFFSKRLKITRKKN